MLKFWRSNAPYTHFVNVIELDLPFPCYINYNYHLSFFSSFSSMCTHIEREESTFPFYNSLNALVVSRPEGRIKGVERYRSVLMNSGIGLCFTEWL